MSSWDSRQVELALGLVAGVVTSCVTHPLDLLKIRLQLLRHSATHRFELIKLVTSVIVEDAKKTYVQLTKRRPLAYYYLQQWYRGVVPNLIGNTAAWSIYFTLYAEFKPVFNKLDVMSENRGASYFGASFMAGIMTSIVTNPIWVLKTRILSSSRQSQSSYKSVTDGVLRIIKEEGVSTFWHGTLPSLFQVLQASVQFSIYDQLKDWIIASSTETRDPGQLSTFQYFYSSAISKTLSMCLFYPTQVVRSRLQERSTVKGTRKILDLCRLIWHQEDRFRGFYRGMGANMVRVVPSTCITFVTYETVKKHLKA